MVKIEGLTCKWGKFTAIDNLSMSIKKGEITALLGENGAGKSTLISTLAGSYLPFKGDISIGKTSLMKDGDQYRAKTGYFCENSPLYPDMSVEEIIEFFASLNIKQNTDDELIDIVDKCGLGEVVTKSCSKLSKGYRQRVGLAISLCGNPELLLLDEPFSGLDPSQISEIRKIVIEKATNKYLLFSSHILQEVLNIAKKVIVISNGQIIAESLTENFKSDKELEKWYKIKIGGINDEK